MRPIRLSDEELSHVLQAARPLPVEGRDSFLQEVATLLGACPDAGPGDVMRAIAVAQRRHFDPPELEHQGLPRWSRKDGGFNKPRAVAAEG
jgi:hypothetical protein